VWGFSAGSKKKDCHRCDIPHTERRQPAMSVPIIPRNSYRVTVLSSSTAETAQQEPEIKTLFFAPIARIPSGTLDFELRGEKAIELLTKHQRA